MNRRNWMSLALGLTIGLSGCAKGTEPAEASSSTTAEGQEAAAQPTETGGSTASAAAESCACPMNVAGTTVKAADVEGGIALEFASDAEHVAELRQKVQKMATMHNDHTCNGEAHGAGHAHGMAGSEHGMASSEPEHGHGHGHGHGMGPMIDAVASVEDTASGARLIFKPRDSVALDQLREQVRERAGRMADHSCPMMHPANKGAPPA